MLARTIVLFVLVRTIVLTQPRRSHVSVPTIGHVALTVRDLGVSVPWYNDLFEVEPVLDEDTGPFRHVVWAVGQPVRSAPVPGHRHVGPVQRAARRLGSCVVRGPG